MTGSICNSCSASNEENDSIFSNEEIERLTDNALGEITHPFSPESDDQVNFELTDRFKSKKYYQNIYFETGNLKDLKQTDIRFLNYLISKINLKYIQRDDKDFCRYDSVESMALETLFCARTVKNCKRRLEQADYIRLFRRYWNGKRSSDVIFLTHKMKTLIRQWIVPSFKNAEKFKKEKMKNRDKAMSRTIENMNRTFSRRNPKKMSGSPLKKAIRVSRSPKLIIRSEIKKSTKTTTQSVVPSDRKRSRNKSSGVSKSHLKMQKAFKAIKKICPHASGTLQEFEIQRVNHGFSLEKVWAKILELKNNRKLRIFLHSVNGIYYMLNPMSYIYRRSGCEPGLRGFKHA